MRPVSLTGLYVLALNCSRFKLQQRYVEGGWRWKTHHLLKANIDCLEFETRRREASDSAIVARKTYAKY